MWTVIVPADDVYAVWPRDQRTPCAIRIFDDERVAYLTSKPYQIQHIDALGFNIDPLLIRIISPAIEGFSLSQVEVSQVDLRQLLKLYEMEVEGLDFDQIEVTTVELRQLLKSHSVDPEGLDFGQLEALSVVLRSALVSYVNWPDEGLDFGQLEPLSVVLT